MNDLKEYNLNKYARLDAYKSIVPIQIETLEINHWINTVLYFSSLSSLNESTGSLNRSYNDISDQENGIYVIVRWV